MLNYEYITKYRKEQLNKIKLVLKKSSELIAFVKVYGALYDDYYNRFIFSINNLSERYLQTENSELIDNLYNIYSTLREQKKSEKEIFERLRFELYNLPAFVIAEVSDRNKKYK